MKYIYTAEDCPKCETLKKKYKTEGVRFVERNANRIKQPEDEIETTERLDDVSKKAEEMKHMEEEEQKLGETILNVVKDNQQTPEQINLAYNKV